MIKPWLQVPESSSPSYTGPLDIVPGAVVAYGQRALSAAKLGTALYTIRRDSDDTTQSFNSDAVTGDAPVAGISSFIGVGNGFVTVWNDQGVTGANGTQATHANQPGWLANVANGKPALNFVSDLSTNGSVLGTSPTSISLPNGEYTVFAVIKGTLDPNTEGNNLVGINDNTYDINAWAINGNIGAGLFKTDAFVDGATFFEAGWMDSGSPVADAAHVVEIAWSLSTGLTLVDGTSQPTTQVYNHPGTSTLLTNPLAIGGFESGDGSHGLQNSPYLELIIYSSVLSAPDRLAIRQNIARFYGITLS